MANKGIMKNAKLTAEQQELAENNYRLVWKLFHKWRKKCSLTNDELYDCCIDALLYTARKYDASTGFKFSTLMFIVIKKIIINALRDREALKRKANLKALSFEYKTSIATDETEDIEFINFLKCYDDYDYFINAELAAQAMAVLNDKELQVVTDYFYNELSQFGIAAKENKSQTYVSKHYRKALKKMQGVMKEKILV